VSTTPGIERLVAWRKRRSRALVAGFAACLFAGIFGLRLAITNPTEAILLLFALPIALLAVSFDERAGVAAAALSLSLMWLWSRLRGVEVGALTYLARGVTFFVLGGVLGRFSRQLRRRNEALHELAERDPLTGLFNRRRFEEELARSQHFAQRYGTESAFLLLDLDDFKAINDAFGHAVGDAVLRRVGLALHEHLRGSDIAVRLGGDEFAALLPNTALRDAKAVAGKLSEELRRIPALVGRPHLQLTASFGLALVAGTGESTDELFAAVDRAMYEAKRGHAGDVRQASQPPAPLVER
jgi:diguanylate cyclase (GGDEF)-like protein